MHTLFSALLIVVLISVSLHAQPENSTPKDLLTWKDWVLYEHADQNCPKGNSSKERICSWPSELTLRVTESGVMFSQAWEIYHDSWVALPGDNTYWPIDVKVAGIPVLIKKSGTIPKVKLKKGRYTITGKIVWESIPKSLQLPKKTALIDLTFRNKKEEVLTLDTQGKIWFEFKNATKATDVEKGQEVRVYRKIIDGIPLKIETRVELKISGSDREISMGRFLLEGAEALSLNSELPARIESNGALRIQVRPGNWIVTLVSRQIQQTAQLQVLSQDTLWPQQEIWSFEADPTFRVVQVEGVTAIDPTQAGVPGGWRTLPTYLVRSQKNMILKEEHRGDVHKSSDELTLSKDLWIDFDGKGMTIRDNISGVIKNRGRLTTADGVTLGSVKLYNQPQLITRKDSLDTGIEVDQGKVEVEGVSRYLGGYTKIPATGWKQDFKNMNASVYIPPGWMLLGVTGADASRGTWIDQWTLLDIFLVMLIAAVIGKLMGLKWGVIAGITLILIYHETDAPVFSWLNLIVVVSLLNVLPDGMFKKLCTYYKYLSLLLLFVFILMFAITQVRQTIYPQLAQDRGISSSHYSQSNRLSSAIKSEKRRYKSVDGEYKKRKGVRKKAKAPIASRMMSFKEGSATLSAPISPPVLENRVMQQYDESVQVQTGPAIPQWRWESVELTWDGIVQQEQRLGLIMISPLFKRALAALQLLLVGFLFFKLIRSGEDPFKISHLFSGISSNALFVVGALMVGSAFIPQSAYGAFPSDSLLHTFEKRLLEYDICNDNCISLNKTHFDLSKNSARITLQVDAHDATYFPLPARLDKWMPHSVLVNGKKHRALSRARQGILLIALPKGHHQVVLEGPITTGSVEFVFKLPIHNVTANAEYWSHTNIVKGTLPGGKIEFTRRVTKKSTEDKRRLLPDPIKPFVVVKRTLHFHNDWSVRTTVERVAPNKGVINFSIPLLKGESVLSTNVENSDGIVTGVIKEGRKSTHWNSTLQKKPQVTLTADIQTEWVEVWTIDASTKWHLEVLGIARLKENLSYKGALPHYKPWPGESITISVTKPKAVAGSTQTIQSVKINHEPGIRSSKTNVTIGLLSSQGGKLSVTLPDSVVVEKLWVGGVEQIISQNGSQLRIPVRPGSQEIILNWVAPIGSTLLSETPEIIFNQALSNVELTIPKPEKRWILLLGGPDIGPAMLYWGVLIVLILLAFVVARLGFAPLKTWHWILLFLGMSTVVSIGGFLVIAWFFILHKRRNFTDQTPRYIFNSVQVLVVLLTLAALASIIYSVPMGLLGSPDMQIGGNDSSGRVLRWYADFADSIVPTAWMVSIPLYVYRLVMLVWSVWIALMLIKWVPWAWSCFSAGQYWVHKSKPKITSGDT